MIKDMFIDSHFGHFSLSNHLSLGVESKRQIRSRIKEKQSSNQGGSSTNPYKIVGPVLIIGIDI